MRTFEITVDALDAERVADFWCQALGYRRLYVREPYVVIGPPDGEEGPRVNVQRVPERPSAKARVHLDLRVADPDAEAARLVALGATRRGVVHENGYHWVVLADPEGAELCVCFPRR